MTDALHKEDIDLRGTDSLSWLQFQIFLHRKKHASPRTLQGVYFKPFIRDGDVQNGLNNIW